MDKRSSEHSQVEELEVLDKKITIATEGFTTNRFCELLLRDRNKLSKENALTICDYITAMKREVNPRLSYERNTMQFLSELSKAVGIEKKFIDMTRDDVFCYLDKDSHCHYYPCFRLHRCCFLRKTPSISWHKHP